MNIALRTKVKLVFLDGSTARPLCNPLSMINGVDVIVWWLVGC